MPEAGHRIMFGLTGARAVVLLATVIVPAAVAQNQTAAEDHADAVDEVERIAMLATAVLLFGLLIAIGLIDYHRRAELEELNSSQWLGNLLALGAALIFLLLFGTSLTQAHAHGITASELWTGPSLLFLIGAFGLTILWEKAKLAESRNEFLDGYLNILALVLFAVIVAFLRP